MKKILKTLILSLLVLIVAMTTACAKEEEPKDQTQLPNLPSYQGTHIYTAPEVEDGRYIVKDGEFLYTVVVPETATKKEQVAKEEFVVLLKRAIGVVANTVVDTKITEYNPNGKYISIGQTSLLEKAGISIDRNALKTNGARIITKHDNIFLTGGIADGALNAVYDFFNICFDYEWYGKNNLYINDKITDLKLRNFDVTDIPDINTHQITYGLMSKASDSPTDLDKKALASPNVDANDIYQDIDYKSYRSRYNGKSNDLKNLFPTTGIKSKPGKADSNGYSQHSVLNIFSAKTAKDLKDKGQISVDFDNRWLADSYDQICWTAHGDAESYKNMITFAVERCIGYLKANKTASSPSLTDIMFGVEDGGTVCRCGTDGAGNITNQNGCAAAEIRDGAHVGAAIRFVRQVYDRLKVWMETEEAAPYRRETLRIVLFAYNDSAVAPTHKNDKGEWVVNEGLFEGMEQYRDTMFDNLVIWKTFSGASFFDVTSENKIVEKVMDEFDAWAAIFDNVYAWNYAEFYRGHAYFMDYLSQWNSNMVQYYSSIGMEHMITELSSSGDSVTAWGDLYYYMITKLSWDGSLSSTELITKFMKAHYGPAAESMEKLYYAQKQHFQKIAFDYYIASGMEQNISIGNTKWTAEQFPYAVVKGFINYIDQAYADIEDVKLVNPGMYDVYKDRISVEGISHYYTLLDIYGNGIEPYSVEEKAIYKQRAKDLLGDGRVMKGLDLSDFIGW